MRVLIVDDERHVVEGLRQTIPWPELGIDHIDVAENGEEAWKKYSKNPPDFLITDLYMPKMNGIELIRKIREQDSGLLIVVLSGYDDFASAQEAIHLNVSRYILKPCLPEDILREMRDLLAELHQKRGQKELFSAMQEQIESSFPILQEQFLYQLISAGVPARDLNEGKLSFYRLDADIVRCALVMSVKVYPTGLYRDMPEYQWQLRMSAASEIIKELVTGSKSSYVLRGIADRIPVLICGGSPGELAGRAKQASQRIISAVQQRLHLDVNVGIGQAYEQTIQYPLSQKESIEALSICESEGVNQYLCADEIKNSVSKWPVYPLENHRLLADALLCMDEQAVFGHWGEMEQALVQSKAVPIAWLQSMCVTILGNLALRIMESETAINPDEMAGLLESIQKQHSVKELMQAMKEKIGHLVQTMKRQSEERAETPYVGRVKRTVECRFSEQIRFSQLAKDMNISRNYLSSIFKRETGVNFMTYLTCYRMEKAKDLLRKKQYMVYEVAERVGYQDAAYFSRMFKNTTGMSPLEYIMKEGA